MTPGEFASLFARLRVCGAAMRQARANRTAFRRAVWASVALHAVAAVALVTFVSRDERPAKEVGIDTRAEASVRMSMPEVEVEVAVAPPPLAAMPAQPATPRAAEPPSIPAQLPSPPEPATLQAAVRPAPQFLPPEMLARIRLTSGNPSPMIDTGVHQAAGTSESAAAPAIHGPLAADRTVVYVLDCSGSMGAAGKFDAARAALVSTLKAQPPGVRFAVIVYTGTASPLLAGTGTAHPATAANIRLATDALAKLEPRGASNHLGAVRAALAFRPDVVLMLTDADDLNASALKSVAKSVPLCVGRVTAAGVQSPQELK